MTSEIPPIVFTDLDGVWTDGGMYYDSTGDILRKYNTRDSGGVLLLRSIGIRVVAISGEAAPAAARRMQKLGVDATFLGVRNKLQVAREFAIECGVRIESCAHIGDDINDLPLLRSVRWTACPKDASAPIVKVAEFVCTARGGEGAFREFAEHILSTAGRMDEALAAWLASLNEREYPSSSEGTPM